MCPVGGDLKEVFVRVYFCAQIFFCNIIHRSRKRRWTNEHKKLFLMGRREELMD